MWSHLWEGYFILGGNEFQECFVCVGLWALATWNFFNCQCIYFVNIYEERSGVKYCDFLESLLRLTLQYVVSTGRKICIALAD